MKKFKVFGIDPVKKEKHLLRCYFFMFYVLKCFIAFFDEAVIRTKMQVMLVQS